MRPDARRPHCARHPPNHEPTIFDRLVNGCWYLFRATLALAVVAALAVGAYFYLRIDDETRRIAESVLNRACAPLTARVGAASFAAGRSVTLRDVEIVDPRPGAPPECVLKVDELRLEGDFDVATLLRDSPRVSRVVVRRPLLCCTREADGRWNLARLKPPEGDGGMPSVTIVDGAVRVADRAGAFAPYTLRNAALDLEPGADGGAIRFEGSLDGGVAERIRAGGEVDPAGGALRVEVEAQNATLNDELVALVAGALAPGRPVPSLRGRVSLTAEVSREGAGAPLRWRTSFRTEQAQVWFPRLQQPLTDVAVVGEASDESLLIERATARWGGASLAVVGRRSGWGPGAPAAFRCRADGVDVKNVPIELLPSRVASLRDRFDPTGVVSVVAEAAFDGRRWSPRATVRSDDASFLDNEKFRYRLRRCSGRLDVNGGVEEGAIAAAPGEPGKWSFSLDMTGAVEGAPVRVSIAFPELSLPRGIGPVARAGAKQAAPMGRMPVGWIELSGVGVPIAEPLVEALDDETTKQVLRSLRPRGAVDLRWRGEKHDDIESPIRVALDMRLADCRINYDRFPYPLERVTGWVRQVDRNWRFDDLVSRDERGQVAVRGSGDIVPAGDDALLTLRLKGVAMPLDETLRAALPNEVQETWAYLRPRGRLDFETTVTHRLVKPPPGAPAPPREIPDVRLTMWPHNREVSVEPMFTPGGRRYRLDRVDGRFDWQDGRLTMVGARAEHGRTAVETDGVWESAPRGWRLRLTRLHADRVTPDHDLLLSSPPGLRTVLETLRPRGGFDVFNSSLEVVDDGTAHPAVRWDVGLDCHQASIQTTTPVDGISGVVRLRGSTDGVTAHTAGELELDSLFWNDLQLTNVRGPLWADGVDCWFGEGACRKTGSGARRVAAEAYGGRLSMNGHVRTSGRARYGLQTNIDGVDVGRLAAEWMASPEAIGGRLDGFLEVQGVGESVYGMQGRGALRVNDADLYELPVMARLLKVLRNRAPDGAAFDTVEAEFDLHGEQIDFSRLDLKGDAFSLYGDGRATLDRELDLTFGSVVGRTDFVVPMFRSLVGQASEQLLRIRVLGTTEAPEIRREALPAVGDVFEQLQADRAQRATPLAPPSAGAPRGAERPPNRINY